MEVQTLDIISVNIWSILISLGNLVLLYFILKKFLFKPVRKVVEERKAAVESIYDSANSSFEKAEADRVLYEEKLKNAENEAIGIVSDARERAKAVSESIINDANGKAAAAMRRADENIALEKKRAVNDMKNEISDISVDIAEKVIGREISEDDHRELIDSFIDSIE